MSEIEVLILWPADFDVIGGDLGKQIAVFITELKPFTVRLPLVK